MTALTVTAQPSSASVLVTVTGAPAGAVALTRTDANGTNTVRLRLGQTPNSGTLIVTDYEPALTGLLAYSCVDAAGATVTASTTFDNPPPTPGAETRRNLITNPRFALDTSRWSAARGTAERLTVAGATLLRYTASGTAGGNYINTNPRPAVSAGTRYQLSGKVSTPTAGALSVTLDLVWFNDANGVVAIDSTPPASLSSTLSTLAVTAVAPATATSVQVRLLAVGTMTGAQQFDSTDFILEAGPELLPYFDGATPATDTTLYSWAGAAHASESLAHVAVPAPAQVPRLTSVQLPQVAAPLEYVTGYDAARASTTTVHRVIGRDDPVVILGRLRTRDGRLESRHRDHTAALAAADTLAAGGVVLFRQPTHPGLDMYFVASNVRTEPIDLSADGWRWRTTADYVEVKAPALPLLGAAGWSYNDLTARASYSAVRTEFGDYAAVTVGTP